MIIHTHTRNRHDANYFNEETKKTAEVSMRLSESWIGMPNF